MKTKSPTDRFLVFSGLTKTANDSGCKDLHCYWLPPATDAAEFEARMRGRLATRISQNTTVYWSSTEVR